MKKKLLLSLLCGGLVLGLATGCGTSSTDDSKKYDINVNASENINVKTYVDHDKDYLIVSGIVLVIFFTIFIFKGIYPFGDYTIAFSDMQAQIIDFYYHFRSSIIGNSSLFIDFNTSWGTDFFSQFVHYINSPFTLLTLIIPKSDVYKCVSLITMFKFLTASLTSLYFFKYYFKKINSFGLISLSLMYTFCGYGLVLYQITMFLYIKQRLILLL